MYPFTAGIITQTKALWEELRPAMEANSIRVVFELAELPDNWPAFLERIERVRPEVVVIEVTNLREPIEDVIRRIRSTSAQPAVFALHTTADPQAILSALRSGATEFLSPPLSEPLTAAFQRLEQARKTSGSDPVTAGKTLGFLSVKGGCGATTIACHIATYLGQLSNQKVLLADFDTQSGLIGFLTKARTSYSIADAAGNLQRLDPSYWRALVSNGIPNLEVIPAPNAPISRELPPTSLKQVIAFARTLYGCSVIDLGRSLTPAITAMAEQMDEIFLVTTYDVPALHQAKFVCRYFLDHGYAESRLRVIVNRKPRHMDLTLEEIGSMLKVPVYATLPDEPQDLQEAYTKGRLLEPNVSLGKALMDLARKIAKVEAPKSRRLSFLGL